MRNLFLFIVFLWRFFTGNHMDGHPRCNSTWSKPGNAPAHRAHYYWNRISRRHRMAWRNGVFWPIVLILWGQAYYPGTTDYILSASVPFFIWLLAKRIVMSLTMLVRSMNGTEVEEYRILRPIWKKRLTATKRAIHRIRPFARPSEHMPETVRQALLADNEVEHGDAIISVRDIFSMEDE